MGIVWSSALETGVRSIDLQHEELIGIINELDAARIAGSSQTLLDGVIQRLESYIIFHFRTEEAMMSGLRLAEKHASEHLQQHHNFVEQIAAIRAKVEGEYNGSMGELVDFLNTWLYEHILKTDRKLGALLNGQLAQSTPLLSQG